jgi:hypothetical protein
MMNALMLIVQGNVEVTALGAWICFCIATVLFVLDEVLTQKAQERQREYRVRVLTQIDLHR